MNIRCTNPALLIYLLFVYLIPAFLNWWIGHEPAFYEAPKLAPLSFIYLVILFLVTASFAFLPPISTYSAGRTEKKSEFSTGAIFFILIGILIISINGATSGFSRWRYADDGLSSALGPTQLLYVVAPNILEIILFLLIFFNHGLSRKKFLPLLMLLTVCLMLTASGIGPMVLVILAFAVMIWPESVRRLLFRPKFDSVWKIRKSTTRSLIFIIPVLSVIAIFGYLIGDSIKRGVDIVSVIEQTGFEGFRAFLIYLLERLSVQWYSLLVSLNRYVELGLQGQLENLYAPLGNAAFRLSALLGGVFDVERPVDGSIARINYGLINLYPFNDREGTTPGLIASFVIAFPAWFSPIALASYLSVYSYIQQKLRSHMGGDLSLIGEIVFLYFTVVFFSSPVDFLLIFDPLVITIIFWCYIALRRRTARN